MNQRMPLESLTTEDAAAFWFARVRSGQMTDAESTQFSEWKQDSANDHAYKSLQGIWNATSLVPAARLRALAQEPVHQPERVSASRRRTIWALGTAACAVGAGALVLPQWLAGLPEFETSMTTARGERRETTLPDNSVIAINTATQLTVRLYQDRRVVSLAAGEATFKVTKDSNRPFYVEADATTIRVTGTQFNVRREAGSVRVSVVSGAVEVSHNSGKQLDKVMLGANDAVTVADASGLGAVEKTDVASTIAWHTGRVVFFDTPLVRAIGEINRYTQHPIQINDPAVAKMRIAGVFNIDNPSTFLRLLPEIAPVAVQKQQDGSAIIVVR
jgi:transmembrane sensor